MACGAPSRHTSVTTNIEDRPTSIGSHTRCHRSRMGSRLCNDDDDDDDDDEDRPTTPIPRKALDTADLVTRQALGRIAKLGDFYDATSDTFCGGMSIFRQQLPPDLPAVSRIHEKFGYVKRTKATSLKETFSKLNVAGDLQLSVIAGMCDPGVSATYLKQKKDSFKSVEILLIYYIPTVTEQLNFFDDHVKKYISQDNISRSGATHVVSEIKWGASGVIKSKSENRENSGIYDFKQYLQVQLTKLWSWCAGKISGYVGKYLSQAEPEPKALAQGESQNASSEK